MIEAKDFNDVKNKILEKNADAEIGRIVKKDDYKMYYDTLYEIKKKHE